MDQSLHAHSLEFWNFAANARRFSMEMTLGFLRRGHRDNGQGKKARQQRGIFEG
jgi:hypothetical protein